MKTAYFLTILSFLSVNILAQQKITIDANASKITWTGHAEIGSYSPAGTLNFLNGWALVRNGNIANAELTIDMNSMKQENEHLLTHLKSEDFFDVKKFPVSVITVENITNGLANGKLKIKNKTLPFNCRIAVKKLDNYYVVTGTMVVDRTAYGIIYNSGNFFSGLGDKAIKNTFDVAFNLILR